MLCNKQHVPDPPLKAIHLQTCMLSCCLGVHCASDVKNSGLALSSNFDITPLFAVKKPNGVTTAKISTNLPSQSVGGILITHH
ncbi:unnamed protein product [Lactuca virosa]|uniref:Uncharacterized protein n=1 Tax=Lactuca virosa TaxID=75947 RepID=A0AAU9N9U7_9ASTR|nr:unnamed protein product [Lactuca virosa]